MKNTFKNPVPSLAKIFNSSLIVALALVAAGCPKKAAVKAVDIPPVIQKLETKCVQVYYDKTTASSYTIGKTYALMLLNLLGHFPDYQQTLSPIESYKNGDLEKCDANFYIGSSFDNPLPQAFLVDYKSTTKLVTWMGYNFWQLGPEFERTFGYRDHVFTALDEVNRTPAPESKPTFFRDILYKGETFTKFNAWKPTDSTVLQGAFEMCKLSTKTSDVSQVLATARHSFNNEEIPWALQNHNKFYVTEIPFSYAHEGDRYLVFSDLLFDMIGAKPMSGGLKRAVIRLADINPLSQLNWLDEAAGILKSNGVLPHLSVQPIFNDPDYAIAGHDTKPEIRLETQPALGAMIEQYASEGSVVIWHGSSLEYNNTTSGDNEFWNSVSDSPLSQDDPTYVLGRLDNGFKSFEALKLNPQIWETPHYHASALDNVMFGRIFKWSIGRGTYTNATFKSPATLDVTKALDYKTGAAANAQNRKEVFAGFSAKEGDETVGQFFPYEIYGDIYGQGVVPENLGSVSVGSRTAEQILQDAKRNLVLRDCWASVYYASDLLDPSINPGNASTTQPKDLARIVTGLKALGYTFVNLHDFIGQSTTEKAKPRIEIQ